MNQRSVCEDTVDFTVFSYATGGQKLLQIRETCTQLHLLAIASIPIDHQKSANYSG
jgi:hypothetical protein